MGKWPATKFCTQIFLKKQSDPHPAEFAADRGWGGRCTGSEPLLARSGPPDYGWGGRRSIAAKEGEVASPQPGRERSRLVGSGRGPPVHGEGGADHAALGREGPRLNRIWSGGH